MPLTPADHFSLNTHGDHVTQAREPEELRDILCYIFHEMSMRLTHSRVERTGFEAATSYKIQLAFYYTVNEMVRRMH